ncbi:MAG: DUF1016 family protein [Parachlamydiaceae bacterium]|nr:DUF1016 family protein [Parachlamydiaceae bacterium]
MLTMWIDSGLFKCQVKAVTNFRPILPTPQSDLAIQTLKNLYHFLFLSLERKYRELELKEGLIDHLQRFLLELGDGFAFFGRKYRIEVSVLD